MPRLYVARIAENTQTRPDIYGAWGQWGGQDASIFLDTRDTDAADSPLLQADFIWMTVGTPFLAQLHAELERFLARKAHA